MTVPSGSVKMTDVRAEFGGTAITPLTAYLKGGAFVPVQTLAPIPAALPINLHAFAGATFPASMAYTGNNNNGGWAVGSAVVAPDLSTATFVLTRTRVVNGGSSWTDVSGFNIQFAISGCVAPSVILRLPATQPQDGNGYWKQPSTWDLRKANTPANLNPIVDYPNFSNYWHILDSTEPYRGELRLNTIIPLNNQPTPPQISVATPGGVFVLPITIVWSMTIGTAPPPGVQMTWNTRNVSNTFVEFPIVIDIYDGGILRASYPMLLHMELNALTTFNPS